MKCLVTGSSGFLGTHLMEALRFHPSVTSLLGISRRISVEDMLTHKDLLKCDIEDAEQVKRVMGDFRPDKIFHLAANPLVKQNASNPFAIHQTNIVGTHHVVEYAPKGTHVLFASSATVYGNNEQSEEGDELWPSSVYGVTKVAAEQLLRCYWLQQKIKHTSLRLVSLCGKGATHGIVPDIIRKLRSPSPTLDLIGIDPGTRKQFLHVRDAVEAFIYFAFETSQLGEVNISPISHDILSCRRIAEIIMEEIGIQKPISFTQPAWDGDQYIIGLDNEVAGCFGWQPRYSSESAIRLAVREGEFANVG